MTANPIHDDHRVAIVFKSPPNFQIPCSSPAFESYPPGNRNALAFRCSSSQTATIPLVTGWVSVAAHEAWIRGERNQELLCAFAPYVDMQKIRAVHHVGVDFETIPNDAGWTVVERYDGQRGEKSTPFEWERSDLSKVVADRKRFGSEMCFALSALLGAPVGRLKSVEE